MNSHIIWEAAQAIAEHGRITRTDALEAAERLSALLLLREPEIDGLHRMPVGMTLDEATGVMDWYGVKYYSDTALRGLLNVKCNYCPAEHQFPTQNGALDVDAMDDAGWGFVFAANGSGFECDECAGRDS